VTSRIRVTKIINGIRRSDANHHILDERSGECVPLSTRSPTGSGTAKRKYPENLSPAEQNIMKAMPYLGAKVHVNGVIAKVMREQIKKTTIEPETISKLNTIKAAISTLRGRRLIEGTDIIGLADNFYFRYYNEKGRCWNPIVYHNKQLTSNTRLISRASVNPRG